MLNKRIYILTVMLVLMLIAWFVTARIASASNPSENPSSPLRYQAVTGNQINTPVPPFSSLLEECSNLPSSEHASCLNASRALAVAVESPATLVEAVRQATKPFKNLDQARAAGYALFHGCVSGPQEGAMGIHFVNGDLVGDGILDPMHPEALLYKYSNGQAQLVGVEYVVVADDWDASHEGPPVLMGQLFNYIGSPNRYGIPAFYELHVWAWDRNPRGSFADWNPRVSCDDYFAEAFPDH